MESAGLVLGRHLGQLVIGPGCWSVPFSNGVSAAQWKDGNVLEIVALETTNGVAGCYAGLSEAEFLESWTCRDHES